MPKGRAGEGIAKALREGQDGPLNLIRRRQRWFCWSRLSNRTEYAASADAAGGSPGNGASLGKFC
jgi:hypothetical protein